jgi:large subunit ribosomal protein L6
MSRIGKQGILVPHCVDVVFRGQTVLVNGPKGELCFTLPPFLKIRMVEEARRLDILLEDKSFKKGLARGYGELYGLSRTAVFNIIKGVSEGFQKRLRLTGVGYRAAVEGDCLVLNVGYSQVVKVSIPRYISLQCESPVSLLISGIKKDQVGNFASKLRLIRVPEPYKGKGISYDGELIRRKLGKTGK